MRVLAQTRHQKPNRTRAMRVWSIVVGVGVIIGIASGMLALWKEFREWACGPDCDGIEQKFVLTPIYFSPILYLTVKKMVTDSSGKFDIFGCEPGSRIQAFVGSGAFAKADEEFLFRSELAGKSAVFLINIDRAGRQPVTVVAAYDLVSGARAAPPAKKDGRLDCADVVGQFQ